MLIFSTKAFAKHLIYIN